MKAPVDIKAVLDAITDTEEARSIPVSVRIYVDDSAPQDVRNLTIASFKTTVENAAVEVGPYPAGMGLPDPGSDMAVIVAGDDDRTGRLCADLRIVSVPSMVVSSAPHSVADKAEASGYPLIVEDLVAPDIEIDGDEAEAMSFESTEPHPLTPETAEGLREKIGAWIVDTFREKRVAFAYAFSCVRRPLSLEAVKTTSIQNAGIGLVVLIPGADMPVMTLNQMKMLLQIAAAYGQSLSLARAKEMLAVVGGAFACRAVARQLVDVVPVLGWAVKAGIGYAGTLAMGRALVEYFDADGDMAYLAQKAEETAKRVYEEVDLSEDKSFADNARTVVETIGDNVANAVVVAKDCFVPTVKSVAKAAGDATGFTRDDIAGFSSKVVSGVKQAGARFAN